MERRLGEHEWLAAVHRTIADLACYPYVSLAEEGRFSLQPYPAVRAWLAWVEGLRAGCRCWDRCNIQGHILLLVSLSFAMLAVPVLMLWGLRGSGLHANKLASLRPLA